MTGSSPATKGPIRHIGGPNSSYKREVLVSYGPLLSKKLGSLAADNLFPRFDSDTYCAAIEMYRLAAQDRLPILGSSLAIG